ncbi:MAG: DUF2277 domain-containing protein [bacterium]|nr:DUF2277 domain-containing protein [bacterium]
MCRNIRPLFNYEPPTNAEDVLGASLQFVQKISGFTAPSRSNQVAFDQAVADIARASKALLDSLVTDAPPKNRLVEIEKARAKNLRRFAKG